MIVQAREETVKCLSFFRSTTNKELLNAIHHAPAYNDVDHDEDMYSISIFEDLETEHLSEETRSQLAEIERLAGKQNAAYFRFIEY